jgi:two-component system, cell cycle response regulator
MGDRDRIADMGEDVMVPEDIADLEQAEQLLRVDARAALDRSLRALERLHGSPDSVTYQRWLLVKGAAQGQLGQNEDGARILREVRVWAEDNGERTLLALSHRRLSKLFRRLGDPALMLEHAVTAVELLDDDASADLRADHLLGLADALGAGGSFEDSMRRYEEAARLADASRDDYLPLNVLNNFAYTQYEAGLTEEAVATSEVLLKACHEAGMALPMHFGDTVARAYMAAGRLEEAEAVLLPLCARVESGEDCDGLVLALTTMSTVLRELGRFGEAREALDRAQRLVEEYSLLGPGCDVMCERAELYAAEGDYRRAFETFHEFHRIEAELRAVERDARARTLHAIFEATEAQRSSDHFRELSVRDPLTGLHNRRHMDELLTVYLRRVVEQGETLTVALIDLDHFKRVNDTRSHAVGDEVLRTVAGLLEESAESIEAGFAVRMGGEEFLLVMPGLGRDAALICAEKLQAAVAEHDWDLLSTGITVTASIGLAVAPDDSVDHAGLLEAADRRLYEAKRGGRNRVVA